MPPATDRHHITPQLIERLHHHLRRTSNALDRKDWAMTQQYAEDLTAFVTNYAPELADCLTHLSETNSR